MRSRLLLAAATLVVGCAEPTNVVVGGFTEVSTLKAIPDRDLDLLFVVDNSSSMTDNQTALATNFPRIIDALSSLPGGLPNLHIGVVTSDMGTSSAGDASPASSISGCTGTGMNGQLVTDPAIADRYISDVAAADGTRTRNYTGELRDVFAQLAEVGDAGCGFEQHLRAMQAALVSPANAGFLRPDANLAVVILGDEDDCSVEHGSFFTTDTSVLGPLQSFRCTRFGVTCAHGGQTPDDMNQPGAKSDCKPASDSPYVEDTQPFVDALLAAKGDARKVLVSAIVGDPSPVSVELSPPQAGAEPIPALAHSCQRVAPDGTVETADPAVRIASFLSAFPGRSTLTSICADDFASSVDQIGTSARQLMGDPCLDTSQLADSSPAPGVQPTCEVVDVSDAAPDDPHVLPPCGSGATDCWQLVADPATCPASPDHLRVEVHRAAAPSGDTWEHVRCKLAP